MSVASMTWPEVRRAGLEALRERLGLAGMMYFLQMMEPGSGDYTKERGEWLDGLTVEQIASEIRSQDTDER